MEGAAMRALSIRQPWAWLICAGFKDVENRTWPTNFRGRIYIHAGQRFDSDGFQWLRINRPKALPEVQFCALGAIIGEVDIVDCVRASASPWFEGPYGFVLRNPVLYHEPIPMRGRLGLFEVGEVLHESI
jgi:hypothetical protein